MTSRFYVGIDLGKSGGITLVTSGNVIIQWPMPPTDELIVSALMNIVKLIFSINQDPTITIIMEQTSPRPNEGVVSVSTFAKHCGGVYYACLLLSMLYNKNLKKPLKIAPATWKKHFGLLDSKLSKYDKKKLSVDYVNKRFNQSLTYSRNGIADAILIALYLYEEEDKLNNAV